MNRWIELLPFVLSLILLLFCIRLHRASKKMTTDFHKVKQELDSTKERFESFFQNTSDAIAIMDLNGVILHVNPAFEVVYGWRCEEILGEKTPMVPEELSEEFADFLELLKVGGYIAGYETFAKRKDGFIIPVSATLSPIKDAKEEITGYSVILRDITDQKQTEKQLEESNQRYRSLFEHHPDLVFSRLLDGTFESNSSFEKILGYQVEEILEGNTHIFFRPEDKQEIFDRFSLASKSVPQQFRMSVRHKDGQNIHLQIILIPIVVNKEVIGVYGIAKDITKQMEAELSLKESEDRYRQLVEWSPLPILVLQENISFINPVGARVLGAEDPWEIIGRKLIEFVHPSCIESVLSRIRLAKNRGHAELTQQKYVRVDGQTIDVETTGIPITYQHEDALLVVFQDVTERLRTEELIRKSEKLSVVGQLAAGVAHEIRNPLTSIKGFLQLMNHKDEAPHFLRIMLDEIARIEEIIKEFLIVAKPQTLSLQQKDIHATLHNVLTLLSPEANLKNIQLVHQFDPRSPNVLCEENKLKQVLINIIKNAMEAMPSGGKIQVETRQQNSQVLIRIKDEGCGIGPERLSKLGEPFYTTKEKGTGLGLMISHKIIEAHKGKMAIHSEIGKGTTVDIFLPIQK